MKEVKIIRYAYKHNDKTAEFICKLYDLRDLVEESEFVSRESMLYYLDSVLLFIEPEDLGLTNWD